MYIKLKKFVTLLFFNFMVINNVNAKKVKQDEPILKNDELEKESISPTKKLNKKNKLEKLSKKIEEKKKEFYDYVDDDEIPLSLLWSPCINFFWSKAGSAEKVTDIGVDSLNFIRFTLLYDLQIFKSNFFISPGLGISNQDYVFANNKALYTSHKKDSKINFYKASDIIKNEVDKTNEDLIKSTGLHTSYFDFCVELQFRSNKIYYKEGLFATLGFKYSWLLGDPKTYIQFYDNPKDKTVIKNIKSAPLGLNNHKISIILRVGLGSISVFVDMALNNILDPKKFENDKTSLKPFTIGLNLNLL